jgi:S-DNA-T family DNA segregation ATPase FtsK/SpoIIIE
MNHDNPPGEDTPSPATQTGAELATVHHLPTRPATEENEVMEGELLTEEQEAALAALNSQRGQAIERYRGYRRDVQTAYRGVRTAVTHEHTKTLIRHAFGYPLAGISVVAKRWRDTHGTGRYERQMRAAELEGNHERLLEWETRDVAEKQRRHQRVMDWAAAPGQLVKAGAVGLAGIAGLLLALGVVLAVADGQIADVIAPIKAVIDAVAFTVWFLLSYGVFVLLAGTIGALVYLYQQGRAHADVPTWLRPAPAPGAVVASDVDESMIMNALRNLGHPALTKRFKEGWGTAITPTWVQPPLPVGHGWEFALRLPAQVPATSINARKTVLAHNLGRRPEEVWVEVDEHDPMAMKCLVLDPGALRRPVPDYPLLEGGEPDFFTGYPVGIDVRLEPVLTAVFERNFVLAGIMGSGKSTLLMDLLAAAALDPVVDIDVFCFAENNDYAWLEPVAATISMGDTAANVDACLGHIQELHESLTERGQLLKQYDILSVTREAAERDERLRPRIVVIDECQSLFRQAKPEDRRTVVDLLVRFFSAARKYGIVLAFATPTPSDQSLPRDLVAVTSNKACGAIGDKNRNNIVLGEKAHENGISALGLKPAIKRGGKIVELNDVGTLITVGFADRPGPLRTYNLTGAHKAQIIARAVQARDGRVRRAELAAPIERDILADVAAVLAPGEDKVKATDVCARVREHAPRYRPYERLSAGDLQARLAELGCEVTKAGVLMVYTERVHAALAAREGGNS